MMKVVVEKVVAMQKGHAKGKGKRNNDKVDDDDEKPQDKSR